MNETRVTRLVARPSVEPGAVVEKEEQLSGPPPMYQVMLLNDDFTPMEFVVLILQQYFQKDRASAMQIMLKVHCDGRGVCGVYTRDIAATKVELVLGHARQDGHPLQCVMEEI